MTNLVDQLVGTRRPRFKGIVSNPPHLSDISTFPFSGRMDEILAELRELRVIVLSLHPRGVPVPICVGVTGKGTQCRNRASPDSCYCRMHGERPPRPEKVPRVKKPPKPKKIQPEHTHGIGEIGVNCPLCETHGNVWDPTLTDCCFGGDEIKISLDDKDGCTI